MHHSDVNLGFDIGKSELDDRINASRYMITWCVDEGDPLMIHRTPL